jgi:hypothetical protein
VLCCVRLGGGEEYVIVNFSPNYVSTFYNWYDVDIFVYLRVVPIPCPCYIYFCDVAANIGCIVLSGWTIRIY